MLCNVQSNIAEEIDVAEILEEDRLMVVWGEGCQILGKRRRDDADEAILEPPNQLSKILL